MNYRDKVPKNRFGFSDFFDNSPDNIFLGGCIGYGYSGLMLGFALKNYRSAFRGYGAITYHLEYSFVQTGKFKGGQEIGAGIQLLPFPVGLVLNSFVYNKMYSINLRPEIGLHLGQISLVYGYNFKIYGENNLSMQNGHYVQLGIAINISSPINSYNDKYPYDRYM